MTSFTMVGKKENSNDHNLTFPASISSDKSNHTEVRQMLHEDTKTERTHHFFDGNELVKVQVPHFITEQDRPERSKSTGHGYHNAKHSKRFGWITSFDEKLPQTTM